MNEKGTALRELVKSVEKNSNPKVELEMGQREKYSEISEKDFQIKEQ